MASYKPYLIGPITTGLVEGLEPWLLPKDAYAVLRNAYLRRGVLKKRAGYSQWERMVHAVADESIGASGSTNYSGTLGATPLRAGDLSFTDGTQTITDDGDGTLSGDGTGTIDYTTGAYDVTFDSTTTGAVTADYDYYAGSPVVGMATFKKSDGTSTFIVVDTERANLYDTANNKLEDLATADAWGGSADNRIWTATWQDVIYLTNNSDQIQQYDGTTLAAFDIDVDGGGNDINTCLIILAHKERLIILRPTESSSVQPQRARWCKAGIPADWTNDGYADAPTGEWIMSAGFMGDDIVVWFEQSIWLLRYTADADLPFRWERVEPEQGLSATFGMVSYGRRMLGVGPGEIVEFDGSSVRPADARVPDFTAGIDQDSFEYLYMIQDPSLKQILISYPADGADEADACMVFNYAEGSWSRYDYGFNCLGRYRVSEELTWDEIDETWDEIEWSWDDQSRQGGFPIILSGDTDGYVWQLNTGGTDNASAIELEALSGRLNPFVDKGRAARLGYVDLLVTRDADISFTLSLFAGRQPTAYQSTTLVCESPDNTEGKVWLRAFSGMIADFHRIKISQDAANQTLEIHAIVPWFKPAGRLI